MKRYLENSVDALSRIPNDLANLWGNFVESPFATSVSVLGAFPATRMSGGVARTAAGEFSVLSWKGYPDGLARPETLRWIDDAEYAAARKLANDTNSALRAEWGVPRGWQIHEVQPVRFGGNPVDIANKIVVQQEFHQQISGWWRSLQWGVSGR